MALRLRVGLNSGQVIAGEIDSGPAGYTAIGEQLGMAQRMESAAPPGGVMISESTARLVENAAVLGDSELVQIKGTDVAVPAPRLLAVGDGRTQRQRREPTLVGRTWELSTLAGILDQAIDGHGCVAGVLAGPGDLSPRVPRAVVAHAGWPKDRPCAVERRPDPYTCRRVAGRPPLGGRTERADHRASAATP
ncbi:hypothetical protein A4G26_13330 [Mycobacterium kansasii]|nr:hypothetical protein A4G26_13330 [Mycobacterium kansasii]